MHTPARILSSICLVVALLAYPLDMANAGWRNYVRSWWQILYGQTSTQAEYVVTKQDTAEYMADVDTISDIAVVEDTVEAAVQSIDDGGTNGSSAESMATSSTVDVDTQVEVVVVETPLPTQPASEPGQSYTGYSDGSHTVTVPYPGVHEHGARRNADGGTGTGTLRYDPLPPDIGISSMRVSARHNTPIQILFHDRCAVGCGEYTGLELSGVASALITITGPTGTDNYAGASTVTVNHDFSQAGYYDLQWSATDNAGNSNSGTLPNFVRVVASTVEWDADNCISNHETTCPSSITTTASESRVSDGSDTHIVDLKLVDRYGNRVKSIDGVKEVAANFLFDNTVDLNQIAGSGDAARFTIAELSYDETGADTGSTKLTETGYHTEAPDGDGEVQLTVHSYSPTSNAYDPITTDGFDLALTGVSYRVSALGDNTDVGEEDTTHDIPDESFPFIPTLTATPAALNYNTTSGSYEATAEALQNITINAAKRFNIDLENQSSIEDASDIYLGLVMDANDNDITWQDSGIEKAGTSTLSSVYDMQSAVDHGNPLAAGTWHAVPSSAADVTAGATKDLRMQSTPELAAGASTPSSFSTFFRTHANYMVGGRNSRHKSEKLSLGAGEAGDDADVFNVNIQIVGTTRSEQGINTNLDSDVPAANLGDLFISEVKTGIDKNAASFIQGAAASRACTSDIVISDASDWSALPCLFNGDSVAYFRGASVNLSSPTDTVQLPAGLNTILVHGGNIFINDNLVAATDSDRSFGMVALRDDNDDGNPLNDGGNVYIHPDVTNVFGALYAEGSLVSITHGNAVTEYTGTDCPSDGSGGFCDRSAELKNQLLWQGLIISQNTIGGSDKTTPECPAYLGSLCSSNRALARIFDFNYLRTFHAAAGGLRAGGMADDGTDNDTTLPNTPDNEANNHAVVVEYQGAIKNNPPPLFGEVSGGSSGEVGF